MSDPGLPYFNPNLWGQPGHYGYIGSDFLDEEDEEVYVFETSLDERVCDICGPLEGEAFLAEDIEANFPDAYELDDGTIAANLHDDCRCILTLVEEYEGEEEIIV